LDKIAAILLIALLALVAAVSISYYALNQPNQNSNEPSPTLTPTPELTPTPTSTEPASIPKPSVPEFTVDFFDSSYDVPTTYSTDPYTGETITHEGYRVENRTIEVKIKNQPYVHSEEYKLWYNIRIKGHFEDNWKELYSPEGYIQDSGAEYTVRSYGSGGSEYGINTLSKSIVFSAHAEVDFQVEALIGHSHRDASTFLSPWVFEGEVSGWSTTQTIIIP
jgi:hypothetical protein